MLKSAFEELQSEGFQEVSLTVTDMNQGAVRLYERLGFTVAAVRQSYYTNPVEDALVLWRQGLA